MTALPEWLSGYRLDDDALAALASRGLVRRAAKEAARIELDRADDSGVELRYTGAPPALVRLVPGGPRRAGCGCPVAGVCVHIVAACVWAREAATAGSPSVGAPSVELVEALLALTPTAVNRTAGIAAVRKVAAGIDRTPTTIEARGGSLRISWPGAPEIVAVPGGGFAGMLVAGSHGDTAERAWRLEAIVRLFALHDRSWQWPEQVHSPDVVHPGQRDAMVRAREAIESLLRVGLSRVGADGVARLAAAAQRARLEALPLLATLLTQARGRATALAGRADDTSERHLLDALSRAWALAVALHGCPPPLPPRLLGGRGTGEAAETGTLLPLALRWWTAASGARGLTVTLWDLTHRRLETVTTGRAAGADPSFVRSWDAPVLWGVSAETLAGGCFTLTGAERRDDGGLSPTSRTRVTRGARFADTAVQLDELAEAVHGSARGAAVGGFLPPAARLRLVLLRRLHGAGEPELDEVGQELVWPITDRTGLRQLARMPAAGPEQAVIGWLLRDGKQIAAVVLDERDRPLSVFLHEGGRLRLVSPSLTPPEREIRRGWLARRAARDDRPRAHTGQAQQQRAPLGQVGEAVLDVCEALASTGRPALSPRQRDTLRSRAEQASGLGLGSLAGAIEPLLAGPVTPAAVLRAALVADRTRALAAD